MDDFFFIDDSGSKDWETPYSKSFIENPPKRSEQNLNFWRRNYFVLAGVYLSGDTIAVLNPVINEIKKKYFGTRFVEIKSVWMRNPEKRKKYYIDKFNITEDNLLKFSTEWYGLFSKYQIEIQAFVLDKRYFFKKRSTCTPLQELVQVVFDRVELHPKRDCKIVFDQMDREIKTLKHNSGQIIKISNKEIDLGSFQKKYSHREVIFESSKTSNFLQMADNVAYNVYRQFIDYGDDWDNKDIKRIKMYPFFEKISDNFYCDPKTNRVAGYGLVVIPSPIKIRWCKSTKKPDR